LFQSLFFSTLNSTVCLKSSKMLVSVGEEDHDVVQMEDLELRSLNEDSQFQFLTSLKHKVHNPEPHSDDQISSQQETNQTSVKEVSKQSEDSSNGYINENLTLGTSDGLSEQNTTRISRGNISSLFRDTEGGSEISPSSPRQADSRWESVIRHKSDRKEVQDKATASRTIPSDSDSQRQLQDKATASRTIPSDSDLQRQLQDIEENDKMIDNETPRSSSRNFTEDRNERKEDETTPSDSDLQRKLHDIEENDKRIDNETPRSSPREFINDRRKKQQIGSQLPRLKRQLDINAIADAHLDNSSSVSDDSFEVRKFHILHL
jgi:cell fate (sporulation/competence/biofilm development) regulator YlbF (YheA/YmcA/DUF963 family)